jgi:hypothetical protein
MGEALRRDARARRGWWRAGARVLVALAFIAAPAWSQQDEPARLQQGRFTILHFSRDGLLARSLLEFALRSDTFPGLARPRASVLIAIAPDRRRFREWIGPAAPEWGAAIASPGEQRIVMQGSRAGSDAGDPKRVLRHELAHLALHEALGDLPPRWFNEGYASYAAREWGREEVLVTSLALLVRGVPPLDSLDAGFMAGVDRADAAYALAHRAVAEMAALDAERGLTLVLRYWRDTRSLDRALRAAYGLTLPAFDAHWRQRTMRRYGALALVANVTLAAGAIAFLILPLYVVRRRRDRRRMDALRAADEAAERAARESAIDALLSSVPPPPSAPPGGAPRET